MNRQFQCLICIVMVLVSLSAAAQDFNMSLSGIEKVQISSETTIVLKSHNLDQFLINQAENYRSAVPERAKGLKSITSQEPDNTSFGVVVTKNESILTVKGTRDRRAANLVIYLPKNMDVSLQSLENNDLFIVDFTSEIEAKTFNGDIHINNVTGPIIAESLVGNIYVVFDSVHQSSPISIVATNGDVDVSLPKDAKTDLTIRTPRGELYTDFDVLNSETNTTLTRERRKLKGKLNGGGVTMILQTLKGNVFLRKK